MCIFLCLNSCYSKKTSDRDSLFTQIIHTYFSAIIFSIIIYFIINNLSFSDYQIIEYSFILRSWDFPSVNNFLILFIIVITGVIGFFSIFGAYVIGSPSSIAPYEYSLIIWSIIIGYLAWNDFLSFQGYLGLLLILIASFFTLYREYLLHIKTNTEKPIR